MYTHSDIPPSDFFSLSLSLRFLLKTGRFCLSVSFHPFDERKKRKKFDSEKVKTTRTNKRAAAAKKRGRTSRGKKENERCPSTSVQIECVHILKDLVWPSHSRNLFVSSQATFLFVCDYTTPGSTSPGYWFSQVSFRKQMGTEQKDKNILPKTEQENKNTKW